MQERTKNCIKLRHDNISALIMIKKCVMTSQEHHIERRSAICYCLVYNSNAYVTVRDNQYYKCRGYKATQTLRVSLSAVFSTSFAILSLTLTRSLCSPNISLAIWAPCLSCSIASFARRLSAIYMQHERVRHLGRLIIIIIFIYIAP